MPAVINYDKYANMSINQLVTALTNAERKQAKIKEKFEQEISQVKELIAYLKSQVKSNLDKPRFYTTENAPSLNALRAEVEKMLNSLLTRFFYSFFYPFKLFNYLKSSNKFGSFSSSLCAFSLLKSLKAEQSATKLTKKSFLFSKLLKNSSISSRTLKPIIFVGVLRIFGIFNPFLHIFLIYGDEN